MLYYLIKTQCGKLKMFLKTWNVWECIDLEPVLKSCFTIPIILNLLMSYFLAVIFLNFYLFNCLQVKTFSPNIFFCSRPQSIRHSMYLVDSQISPWFIFNSYYHTWHSTMYKTSLWGNMLNVLECQAHVSSKEKDS